MQIIKSVFSFAIFLSPLAIIAQTGYLTAGSKELILLDRLEIKSRNEQLSFSTIKPYARRNTVKAVELIDSFHRNGQRGGFPLSAVDKYNMQRFLMNNGEWSKPRATYNSEKPFLNTFYTTRGNFFEVNNKDFFLAINPVINYQQMVESDNDQNIFINTRGVNIRGMLDKRLGFNMYITDNQERAPEYVQQWVSKHRAVPGNGFYKSFKTTGVDYFDARGSITFNAAKYLDFQFGYDKNFLGTGHRSLFLSDFSNNYTFLKMNTRVWKLNYESILMELMPQFIQKNDLLPRKYARVNHISFNATKWLNIGIFEGVVFGRKDHFDFSYLNPFMFLRPQESNNGSADNALAGIDIKANIAKRVQVYGQLLFDEFKLSELRNNTGWWANKYGYQAGMKYIDAFGFKNVDVQLESNRVRPFTYAHFDSVSNWTHYNQPMAHPLGASFQEFIAIIRAQPMKKLYGQLKLIHYYQGKDSSGKNTGNDIFESYQTRPQDYGWNVGSGARATCTMISILLSYELKENLFIDFSAMQRNYKLEDLPSNSTTISLGFRWNIGRREFDF